MPFRSNSAVGFGGFGATPNPFIRYPGGTVTVDDVGQARDAMQFGGDGGTPRAVVPYVRPTPAPTGPGPTVQVRNESAPKDIVHYGGRPVVETGVTIDPSQTREQTFVDDGSYFSIPHSAMDFTAGQANRPHAAVDVSPSDTYTETDSSRFSPLASNYPYGEPQVETPTVASTNTGVSAGNLDNEPSVFGNGDATNAFDQWWKTTTDAPSITVNAGDSGGSIWSGDSTLADFGKDTSLGSDLNASASDLGFGNDFSVASAEPDPPESNLGPLVEGTGIPVEPDPLNQDYEWTTSPNDRRFLNDGQTELADNNSATRGGDINSFGTYRNPLTLGAYLNTSLASLHFGEGYVWGGDVTYAGQTVHTNPIGTPPADAGTDAPIPHGQINIDPTTGKPYDLGSIPEGVAVSPDVRRGELVTGNTGSPSFGLNDNYGRPLHVTPTARTDNYAFGNDKGYGASLNSQENAKLMASQSFGGNPNLNLVSDSERVFNSAEGYRGAMPGNAGAAARARGLYQLANWRGGLRTNRDPVTGRDTSRYYTLPSVSSRGVGHG